MQAASADGRDYEGRASVWLAVPDAMSRAPEGSEPGLCERCTGKRCDSLMVSFPGLSSSQMAKMMIIRMKTMMMSALSFPLNRLCMIASPAWPPDCVEPRTRLVLTLVRRRLSARHRRLVRPPLPC